MIQVQKLTTPGQPVENYPFRVEPGEDDKIKDTCTGTEVRGGNKTLSQTGQSAEVSSGCPMQVGSDIFLVVMQ